MSTRSGKRIHGSIDSPIEATDMLLKSERKTRSKKHKDDVEMSVKKKQKANLEVSLKKRNNYVSYPADDNVTSEAIEIQNKARRRTRRDTLKEQNIDLPIIVSTDANSDINKSIRKTRRHQQLIEETENAGDKENVEGLIGSKTKLETNEKKKNKKKKIHKQAAVQIADKQDIEEEVVIKKKNKKKKRSKSTVTDEQCEELPDSKINKSMSVDSFHSAAGSPVNDGPIETDDQTNLAITFINHKDKENITSTDKEANDASAVLNSTTEKGTKKKRKNGIINSTFDLSQSAPNVVSMADTVSKKRRKSSIKNYTLDKTENIFELNETNKPGVENPSITEQMVNGLKGNSDKFQASSNKALLNSENVALDPINVLNTSVDQIIGKKKKSSVCNTTFDKSQNSFDFSNTIDTMSKKTRKSSLKSCTFDKIANIFELNEDTNGADSLGNEYLGSNDKIITSLNTAGLKETDAQKQGSTDALNTTIESIEKTRKSSMHNCTFDKTEIDLAENRNATFDKDDTGPLNSTFNKDTTSTPKEQVQNNLDFIPAIKQNSKRLSKAKTVDTTFVRDSDIQRNATVELETKSDDKLINSSSNKSSLISSDASSNITFDKSEEDFSRISITSDESRTDNILNHTPVLIESSIEESRISDHNKTSEESCQPQQPSTPFKREGTFTKVGPDIIMSPSSKTSSEKTPVKRKSLSSPGRTPFPQSSQKEKSKLNVTRSIEKSFSKTSLANVAPRQTKVMFCSPANNPATVSQIKGRVIKSNLKGSNKSFVLNDNAVSPAPARLAGRKRSLTFDAADPRAKRSRPADPQRPLDQGARPRTLSAAAKLTDPGTPGRKAATPGRERSEARVARTRLPNFAALHQKQFAKMESLDECQLRRARRARQLLTPTGCVAMLERISPKGTPPKEAAAAVKAQTPTKKLPTLESLNPGYTRFGFKLHSDVNPFSAPATRPVAARAAPARQATGVALPSRAGATAAAVATATAGRRAAARQAVMREKSFTERRDVTRKENRTVIKGVRTNRRFELQMLMRNIST